MDNDIDAKILECHIRTAKAVAFGKKMLASIASSRIILAQMIQQEKEKELALAKKNPDKQDEKKETLPHGGQRLFSDSPKKVVSASPQPQPKNSLAK